MGRPARRRQSAAVGRRDLLRQHQLDLMEALKAEALGAAYHSCGRDARHLRGLADRQVDDRLRLFQEQAGDAGFPWLQRRQARARRREHAASSEPWDGSCGFLVLHIAECM